MLDQCHSINQAAEIVVGPVGSPHERLVNGFRAFRRATIASDDWPVDLWAKYDCICNTLLAGGTWQKTIDRMDLKTANECATPISNAMKGLADDMKRAMSHPAIRPSATTGVVEES
jgi:hypothetical protein